MRNTEHSKQVLSDDAMNSLLTTKNSWCIHTLPAGGTKTLPPLLLTLGTQRSNWVPSLAPYPPDSPCPLCSGRSIHTCGVFMIEHLLLSHLRGWDSQAGSPGHRGVLIREGTSLAHLRESTGRVMLVLIPKGCYCGTW